MPRRPDENTFIPPEYVERLEQAAIGDPPPGARTLPGTRARAHPLPRLPVPAAPPEGSDPVSDPVSDQAQLVVTARTREGRYVSVIMPRPQAEGLLETLERMVTQPSLPSGPPATVRFRTFGSIAYGHGEVLLTGEAILAVELLPVGRPSPPADAEPFFTADGTIRPGPLTAEQLMDTNDD